MIIPTIISEECEECSSTHADGCYHPDIDMIYYDGRRSILLHELAHATGHPLRLNRESLVNNNTGNTRLWWAEEIVAEKVAEILSKEEAIFFEDGGYVRMFDENADMLDARILSWILEAVSYMKEKGGLLHGISM